MLPKLYFAGQKLVTKFKENLIVYIFFFCLIFFILFGVSEIKTVVKLIWNVNLFFLIIALCLVFLHFLFFTLHLQDVLKKAGQRLGLWFLFKIAIAMNFVDIVVPSQRIGGHIFLFKSLRKKEISKEKRSLSMFISGIANFTVDFIIFLIATIYCLLFIESMTIKIMIAAITGIFFILYVPIAPFFFTSKGEKYVITFFRKIPKRFIERFIKNFSERAEGVFRGYFNEMKKLRPKDWFMPMFFMFLNRIFIYLCLFFSMLSLGYYARIDKVVIAKIIAVAIGFFSYVKIGFFEGALALLLSALAIDYNVAVTSTLIFRLISLWLPTVIGFIFFREIMKKEQEKKQEKTEGEEKKKTKEQNTRAKQKTIQKTTK